MLDSPTTSTLDSPFTPTGTSAAAVPEAERIAERESRSTNVRVLHVINGEHYSGAERVQDLLAARLPEFGFDAGFACVKPERFPEQRQTQQVPLFALPMRRRTDLRVAWQLRDVIRRHEYAIVHAHTVRSALVARVAAKLAGVPFVYHVHSPASRDTTRRWRNWVNDRVERFSLTGAQRLITVSHSLAQHMQARGYATDRLRVVPNGVPACGPLKPRRTPAGSWTLGVVALIRPRKGLEVLLDALALLKQRRMDVRLKAVGPFETTDYESDLKQRVNRLGIRDRVEWVGFTRDVQTQLNKMDLFVLPSLFGEGLPMVVLEAMAAGVPVVGTNVEGVPEAIRHGVDGLIAEPGKPQSLAHMLAAAIQGQYDWQAMRVSAHARHGEKFSDVRMAEGVAAVYDELLRSK